MDIDQSSSRPPQYIRCEIASDAKPRAWPGLIGLLISTRLQIRFLLVVFGLAATSPSNAQDITTLFVMRLDAGGLPGIAFWERHATEDGLVRFAAPHAEARYWSLYSN